MNLIKYLLLIIKLKLSKKGDIIKSSLPEHKVGAAVMRSGKFTMTYQIKNETIIQVLT